MEDKLLNSAYWHLNEIIEAGVTHVMYKGRKAEVVGYSGVKILIKQDGKSIATCPKKVKLNCKFESNEYSDLG